MRTGPTACGACAAMKHAIRAARSRIVPTPVGAIPKSASAQRVQRGSDAQRFGAASPMTFAVLVRSRTERAVARSYAHSASAHAIAETE